MLAGDFFIAEMNDSSPCDTAKINNKANFEEKIPQVP